jgi:hypothetical protein
MLKDRNQTDAAMAKIMQMPDCFCSTRLMININAVVGRQVTLLPKMDEGLISQMSVRERIMILSQR